MKKIIFLVILMLTAFTLVGCSKENQKLDKILSKKQITIITSPDYPPFEFVNENLSGNEKYVGADIELMKYIAKELGVTLKIEVADFNTTLATLSLGTVDLAISGFTYKSERAENYELSTPYYNEGAQGVLILKENIEQFGTFSKLNVSGNEVGAQSSTLQVDYVTGQLKNVTLQLFSTVPNGIVLLDNKDIDGIALAERVADIIISKGNNSDRYVFIEDRFDVSLDDTQLYVIARKGETELIERINQIIQKVKEQNLYEEWDREATDLAMSLGLL